MTDRIVKVLTLGRIKFLAYSPLLYGMGAAIATLGGGEFAAGAFLFGQVLVFLTHLMTHYFNEYYDFDTDSRNLNPSPWTGGSRVLPRGDLAPATSLLIGRLLLGLIAGLSLLLPTLESRAICWLALLLSWGYSGPPLRLSRRALGEFTTTAVLNGLTPLLGFVLQGGQLIAGRPGILAAALLPLAIIEFIRMMVMNMPDREADGAVGKNTLIVKIGMPRAVAIYVIGMVAAYASAGLLYAFGRLPGALFWGLMVSLPLAALSAYGVAARWRDQQAFFKVPYWASTHNGVAAWGVFAGAAWLQPAGWLAQPAEHLKLFGLYLYPAVVLSLGYILPALRRRSARRAPARTPRPWDGGPSPKSDLAEGRAAPAGMDIEWIDGGGAAVVEKGFR